MGPGGNILDLKQTIPLFDGKNFHAWKFRVKLYLKAQGLYHTISGEKKPAKTKKSSAATKKGQASEATTSTVTGDQATEADGEDHASGTESDRALSIICSTLSDGIIQMVSNCETPKALWSFLTEAFEQSSTINRLLLHRKMMDLKYVPGTSMVEHISKVKSIIEEMVAIGRTAEEADKVVYLLGGLPKEYDAQVQIVSNIKEKELNFENVVGMILQEERRQQQDSQRDLSKVDAAYFAKGKTKKNNHKFYCSH